MWYVIQTDTGREQELVGCVDRVLQRTNYKECFIIERECVWRNAGRLIVYQKPLFPSYVIVDTDEPEAFFLALKQIPKLAKLLRTDCEFWKIQEEEQKLLSWMMGWDSIDDKHHSYHVPRSLVILDENGIIRKADGPLARFVDKIVRKRIRKRVVTVEVELMGEKRKIELGIRLTEDE